jgi:hypothetical protein
MIGRPGFTIQKKGGNAYDANHIHYAKGEHGKWIIRFICSGFAVSIPVDEIEFIKFQTTGAGYCGECDERLKSNNYTDPEAFSADKI